jgi:hypothetical protein
MPYINFILLAWIRAKNIKFRYIYDGSFVDKWRQTGYPQIMMCRCSMVSDYISQIYDQSNDVRNMTLPYFSQNGDRLARYRQVFEPGDSCKPGQSRSNT